MCRRHTAGGRPIPQTAMAHRSALRFCDPWGDVRRLFPERADPFAAAAGDARLLHTVHRHAATRFRRSSPAGIGRSHRRRSRDVALHRRAVPLRVLRRLARSRLRRRPAGVAVRRRYRNSRACRLRQAWRLRRLQRRVGEARRHRHRHLGPPLLPVTTAIWKFLASSSSPTDWARPHRSAASGRPP